jgi:DNA processing protein
MGYWEIDDERLRALLIPLRPDDRALRAPEVLVEGDLEEAGEGALDELVARVVWSVLVEPGDRVAGRLIAAVGAVVAARLVLDAAPPSALVEATRGDLDEKAATEALARWAPRRRWDDILRSLEGAARCGAVLVVPGDPEWPEGLALLDDSPPVLLWARGDRALLGRPAIAIVGARAATGYGEHVAMELAAALAARDAVIVSGGAYGIDGMAHRAVLASRGATIAVLAGGLDRLYPSGHEALLGRIAEQGLLLSEAPCGSAPTKWRFLQRNRLIAALSAATIVVEAGRRSGALSTAGHALGLGLPVGLVPGPITSAASAGCHAFLREWPTTLVTGAPDVMRLAFGDDGVLPRDRQGVAASDDDAPLEPSGNPMHTRVLDALRPRRGMTVEEVARSAGVSTAAVRGALGGLELEGSVARGLDGLWRRVVRPRTSARAS